MPGSFRRSVAADRILTAHIERLTPDWTPEARATLRADLDKMNALRRSKTAVAAVTSGGKVKVNSFYRSDTEQVAAAIDKLVATDELSPEEGAEAKDLHTRQVAAEEAAIKQATFESSNFKNWLAKNPDAAQADPDAQFKAYAADQCRNVGRLVAVAGACHLVLYLQRNALWYLIIRAAIVIIGRADNAGGLCFNDDVFAVVYFSLRV